MKTNKSSSYKYMILIFAYCNARTHIHTIFTSLTTLLAREDAKEAALTTASASLLWNLIGDRLLLFNASGAVDTLPDEMLHVRYI